MQQQPLIISAALDASTQDALNALRYRFFPSNRYVLPAHLTLFHALPFDTLRDVSRYLDEATKCSAPQVALQCLRLMGRGFSVPVKAPELVRMHGEIREMFSGQLTPQDAQQLRPHITLQNKVEASQARLDILRAQQTYTPSVCSIVALCLWQYQGGPWNLIEEFVFRSDDT